LALLLTAGSDLAYTSVTWWRYLILYTGVIAISPKENKRKACSTFDRSEKGSDIEDDGKGWYKHLNCLRNQHNFCRANRIPLDKYNLSVICLITTLLGMESWAV
jgi:hypothetical protein